MRETTTKMDVITPNLYIELPWLENPANTGQLCQRYYVSLAVDLRQWWSKKRPQNTKPKFYHWSIGTRHTQAIPNKLVMVNVQLINLMCLVVTFVLLEGHGCLLGQSWYTLLMRPNKVITAVKWVLMSRSVLAGFSDHGNLIYNIHICSCIRNL